MESPRLWESVRPPMMPPWWWKRESRFWWVHTSDFMTPNVSNQNKCSFFFFFFHCSGFSPPVYQAIVLVFFLFWFLLCNRFRFWGGGGSLQAKVQIVQEDKLHGCPCCCNNIFLSPQLSLLTSFVLVSKERRPLTSFPFFFSLLSAGLAIRRWSSSLQSDRGWLAEPAEAEVQGGARLLHCCALCSRAGEVSSHWHKDSSCYILRMIVKCGSCFCLYSDTEAVGAKTVIWWSLFSYCFYIVHKLLF